MTGVVVALVVLALFLLIGARRRGGKARSAVPAASPGQSTAAAVPGRPRSSAGGWLRGSQGSM